MGRLAIWGLRAVIAMLFLGTLFVQAVLVPLLGVDIAHELPQEVFLRWSFVILAILGLVTAEVALVCIWRLLTMVSRDTVFSRAAFRYVDIMIGSAVVATLLAVAMSFALAPGEQVPPGAVLLVVLGGVGTAGIALLIFVMRALLARAVDLDSTASTLRAELDEVI
ncbi:DUF2975 domain-containing protein [Cellulomonas sp. URHD0024]|uniref:DUF2975 domain-containing protein n=1 Tax=Cellulomonas sp. URHD0024 TaxID=1302620 RepID=UPI000405DD45|nr:DUF2975 domain-containing protein [Cellulomonas sp. URHD0024]